MWVANPIIERLQTNFLVTIFIWAGSIVDNLPPGLVFIIFIIGSVGAQMTLTCFYAKEKEKAEKNGHD